MLAPYGRDCSLSRKRHCCDNTPTKSGFNRIENERIFVGERFATRYAMKAIAFEYIEVFYNRKRLHLTRLRLFDPGFRDFGAKSTPRSRVSL